MALDVNYLKQKLTKKALWMLLAEFLFTVPLLSADLSVRAFVDKNIVSAGESFVLSIELSGADANNADSPQPPSLDTFAEFQGSGSSTSVQIVNGQTSQTRTLNFYYRATKVGKFTIGAVTAVLDGAEYRE